MLKEFKEFAMKGNVVDLAVCVVIGAAFQKIVTSLVEDIIMPCISILIGKIDFFHQGEPYVAIVKDGVGIGRTMLLKKTSL